MTLQELRAIVSDISSKSDTLSEKVMALRAFMTSVNLMVNNPIFSSTINVDQFVAAQTAPYLAILHDIEVAADALGTDLA